MVQENVLIFFTKSAMPCGLGAALRNGRRAGKVDFVVVKCGLVLCDVDFQVQQLVRFRTRSLHL